jgi:hypothetical protein
MTIPATSLPGFVHPDPAKIIVPRKHGQVLIEPGLGELEAAVGGQGDQGGERAGARGHFLQMAAKWAEAIGAPAPDEAVLTRPWVITGHQVEFYHAGVWAKVIAADELAKRAEGVAFDILVDHDVLEHLGFDVPEQQGETWKRVGVHWAEAPAVAADGIAAPSAERFEQWDAELAKYPQSQTDSMAFFLSELRPRREGEGYVPWMSRARSSFERAMGMNVYHVPTSLICRGDMWRRFVKMWVENAEKWTAVYNRHLAAYRKRQGIKNDHHPMPDLARVETAEGTRYELPFWRYRTGEPRERLLVGRGQAVDFEGLNIRPRALTLTMFVRMFLADLFIHGIGGALYDQITDGILAELFGTQPPYACVSAAWLLPLGQPLEGLEDLSQLKSRRHHAMHNPQQAIDPFTALRSDVAELILERKTLIAQIAGSLASSRKDREAKERRREWFRALHGVNVALHLKAPAVLARIDSEIAEAEKALEQNKVLLWREYFFGLHTMGSLGEFVARVRGQENTRHETANTKR